ncbi:hypothetical protein CBR_g4253 [Chara braunii]|uniref:CCHC-type domain-containing protein n=1 Tax=Chara braunii TaxID=69332 RepID=A0A388JRA0_CHABU|nr:hypothetical protein CBR_g4253 [Chara braunii]|eukprot:GBG60298.1 hypothetical protein CBR_g4253 [Chara braunii]
MNNGNMNNDNSNNGGMGGYAGNGNGGRGGLECYQCGKVGHIARDCWSRKGRFSQQEDEVGYFVREMMKEREMEQKKKEKEEQQRLKEAEEKKTELDIARRTEEMKLQLEANIAERWRKQVQEAEQKVKEVQKEVSKQASPKVSPKSKTISKDKKRSSGRTTRKKKSTWRSIDSTTTEETSGDEDNKFEEASDDTDEETRRIVRVIRSKFGEIKVKIKGKILELRRAKRLCQVGGEITFTKIVKMATTTERNKSLLQRMLKQSWAVATLARYTSTKLIGLYRTTGLFGKKTTRNTLKFKIDRVLRRKTGVSVRRKVTVKYPYCSEIVKKEVRRLTESVVERKTTDEAVATFVKRKTRIVNTRNKNAGEIVHNHRRYANTQDVVCMCERFGLAKHDGHVLTRQTDSEDVPKFVRNAKSITRPSISSGAAVLKDSILTTTAHLKGIVGLRRCARALYCLITRFSKKAKFHLNATRSMVGELESTGEPLTGLGCNMAIGRCYDIKEMFSSISHSTVMEAVFELVQHFEEEGGRQVRVAVRGKTCMLLRTNTRTPRYVSVKFQTIMSLVKYDLDHGYMVCGDLVKRQTMGIPMGRTTSPVLATTSCAMAKIRFLLSLGSDRTLMHGWRMVDDISIMVGSKNDERSWERAGQILELFEETYDCKLKLERKDEGANTWSFVGGRMYVLDNPVQLYYTQETKNTTTLRTSGKLKYQTVQDYDSYSDKKAKKAVVFATLKRLWHTSTSKALSISVVAYVVVESILRGYTPEVSLGILAKLAKVILMKKTNYECIQDYMLLPYSNSPVMVYKKYCTNAEWMPKGRPVHWFPVVNGEYADPTSPPQPCAIPRVVKEDFRMACDGVKKFLDVLEQYRHMWQTYRKEEVDERENVLSYMKTIFVEADDMMQEQKKKETEEGEEEDVLGADEPEIYPHTF